MSGSHNPFDVCIYLSTRRAQDAPGGCGERATSTSAGRQKNQWAETDRESLAGTSPGLTEAVSPRHFKRQERTQVCRRLVLTGASTLSRRCIG